MIIETKGEHGTASIAELKAGVGIVFCQGEPFPAIGIWSTKKLVTLFYMQFNRPRFRNTTFLEWKGGYELNIKKRFRICFLRLMLVWLFPPGF